MSTLFTRAFWLATLERALKTIAQTAGATIVATGVATAWAVDWWVIAGAALLAGLLSVLSSVGSNAATGDGPSLASEEIPSWRTYPPTREDVLEVDDDYLEEE